MRRKDLKVSLIGIAILVLLILCSCGKAEAKVTQHTSNFNLDYITTSQDVEEYRDRETGVHYLVYRDTSSYAGMGGICPRYNADGTLYVD